MLFVLNLFGVDVCQVYLGPQPESEGREYVSNVGAALDLPFGFSSCSPVEEDDEHE